MLTRPLFHSGVATTTSATASMRSKVALGCTPSCFETAARACRSCGTSVPVLRMIFVRLGVGVLGESMHNPSSLGTWGCRAHPRKVVAGFVSVRSLYTLRMHPQIMASSSSLAHSLTNAWPVEVLRSLCDFSAILLTSTHSRFRSSVSSSTSMAGQCESSTQERLAYPKVDN